GLKIHLVVWAGVLASQPPTKLMPRHRAVDPITEQIHIAAKFLSGGGQEARQKVSEKSNGARERVFGSANVKEPQTAIIFDLRGQRFAVVSFWVQLVVCFVCKNSSRFAEQKLRDRRHAPSDHYWSHLRGEGFCDERFHIVASGVHPFTMIFTFDDG